MSEIKFNTKHKEILDSLLLAIPDVRLGQMFGYPAYFVGGKLFACIYENFVGVKVPEATANELLKRDDIDYFQPLGRRKMKQWIKITQKHSADLLKDKDIFESSMEYVASLTGLRLKKKLQ